MAEKFDIQFEEIRTRAVLDPGLSTREKTFAPSPVARTNWDDPLFEVEVSSCYMSCEITTVQPARYQTEEPACLVILLFTFHPAVSHRFKSAKLTCKFRPADDKDAETPDRMPVIVYHAPHTAYGGYSRAESRWTYSLSAPIQAPGGYFALQPSTQWTNGSVVDHYMMIEGTARGSPRRRCVWTMAENSDSKAGLPLEFQTAIILEAAEPFMLEVHVESKIGRWWNTRDAGSVDVQPRLIDPRISRGKQFAVDKDLEELKLNSWFSGAIDGALVAWPGVLPHS